MTAPATATVPAAGATTAPGNWRRFFAIDERDAFIAFAQTAGGRLLIALTAALAIAPHLGGGETLLAVGAATVAASVPTWRVSVLLAATWTSAFVGTALGWNDTTDRIAALIHQEGSGGTSAVALAIGSLLTSMAACVGALWWVRRAPQSLLARRPLLALLGLEAGLCALAMPEAMRGLPRVAIWSAVFALTPYIWFLPFAIADLRSRNPSPGPLQMAVLRPFWSPAYLPFGKGAAFLRKHLAGTDRDLAITQLKAVKLLLWANVLFAVRAALTWATSPQVPSVEQALDAHLGGQAYPVVVGWAAMVVSTADFSLTIAMWAHVFIGIARLAGYRLPRGSWRPLESRTLADYFNRFHYYFKELLVDLFFVPTFFKVFRSHPRLRMFFATFMAAGVGNALWHFVRDIDLVATLGLARAIETYASYALYCVVLATGVGLSQMRANRGVRPAATTFGYLRSFVSVWSFVVCMHVFSDGSRNHTVGERLSFLASLFGVN